MEAHELEIWLIGTNTQNDPTQSIIQTPKVVLEQDESNGGICTVPLREQQAQCPSKISSINVVRKVVYMTILNKIPVALLETTKSKRKRSNRRKEKVGKVQNLKMQERLNKIQMQMVEPLIGKPFRLKPNTHEYLPHQFQH